MILQNLKGFRDFLPNQLRKKEYITNSIKEVFNSFGFEPLETPVLEYEEILTGKYGAEGDKLMYRFTDNGGRKVAMRYDQTVPLARIVNQYQNDLYFPFKRYQMQNVYRAENTQKGRYREFLQIDADIIGSYSSFADAEIILLAAKCLEKLNIKNYKILLNDRSLLSKFSKETIIAIDKIKKIGREGVLKELVEKGSEKDWKKVDDIITSIENQKPTEKIEEILSLLMLQGLNSSNLEFNNTLARGLDYYTGLIFEIEVEGYSPGSIAGGGRYDNLIGTFGQKQIPAVGFAFGFDRTMEALESLQLFPKNLNSNNILVAFSNPDLQKNAMQTALELREKNINAEYLLDNVNLEKQLKYADKKGISYVLIISDENLILKNMNSGEQKNITIDNIINEIR